MNEHDIQLMKSKSGEEGILLSVQEEGTMMVRVGRKVSTSKEKREDHADQDGQDAKHAKLSEQLQVKSYRETDLDQKPESSSSSLSSSSSDSSDSNDSSSESGFALTSKKPKPTGAGNKTKAKQAGHPTATGASGASQVKVKKTSFSLSPPTSGKEEVRSENRGAKSLDNAHAALQALGSLSIDVLWNPCVGSREREVQAKLQRATNSVLTLQDLDMPEARHAITALDDLSNRVNCMQNLCIHLREDGGPDIMVQSKDSCNVLKEHIGKPALSTTPGS